ncbi:MAG: RidA family protein [candidate division Zixibacteria bacterium]|nr:RidA family protein [candidate division Zixibacteria bacterium]
MKQIISTDGAPAAIGPYSQAVKVAAGTTIYCSGQIAIDPESGELVGTTAEEQCRQVMTNLQAVLKAAGADFSRVVKTTVYLLDMADFGAVNDVYGEFFDKQPPARATLAAKELPKGALVEIDAAAVL